MMEAQPKFSNSDRTTRLQRATAHEYDLIIIGGGITGAAILLDAALRGVDAILIEKEDFASGTSSKSTKLIHGGLRYLKQLELGLVRETGSERAIAHQNICHLVHPEHMLLPIIKKGTFSKFSANIAISVYDFLAKVPSKDRKKSLTRSALLKMEPLLKNESLKSGIQYSEYRTDDARLTIELIKAGVRKGNMAFNYLPAIDLIKKENKIHGVVCKDLITNAEIRLQSKLVVNATGPWFDETRNLDKKLESAGLLLSKGVHIVVKHATLPINNSIYFDAFDGRMIFAIPRGESVYIGTTDTILKAGLDDVGCTQEDADYLLKAVNNYFDIEPIGLKQIVSSWSGVRPLIRQKGKAPTEISRKDEIFVSESNLISIAGGKLTGFRKMAERILDLVTKKLGSHVSCSTKHFKIHHNPFQNYATYKTMLGDLIRKHANAYTENELTELVNNFGKDAELIIEEASNKHGNNLIISALHYCLEFESIYHPIDFLERRIGWLYFAIDKMRNNFNAITEVMAHKFNWDFETKQQVLNDIQNIIQKNSLELLKNQHYSK